MNDDNTQGGAEPSPASAGSQPVAWAAIGRNGQPLWLSYCRQDAEGAVAGVADVVPLYRSPTLTAEERALIASWLEASERAASQTGNVNETFVKQCSKEAKTIRGLLERLA